MRLFKNNIKIFLRTRHIFIATLLSFGGLLIYLAYQTYLYTIHRDVMYYLGEIQFFCHYFFVFSLYVSYEYFYHAKQCGVEESATSHRNGKLILYGNMFLIPLLLSMFACLLMSLFCFAVALLGGTSAVDYYLHIFSVNFLNVFLLGTLTNLLGMCLALKLKRVPAYSIMALIIFIVSPISDMIPGIATDAYGINLWPAKWLFNKILPPNLTWVIDAQYGISNEILRWNLMFFWIFLFLSIIVFTITQKKTKKRLFVTILALILSIANLYGYFLGGSEIILGPYPDSISRRDKEYYREHNVKEKTANFTVATYNISFSIFRDLEAQVVMEIGEPSKNSTYEFTLYHGYKILSVTSQDGSALDYIRDCDYITIRTEKPITSLTVCYRGFSPCLFSNNQAVLLPGCFPYYPMAGFHRISSGGQGYVPIANEFESQYRVQINHLKQLYSNLSREVGQRNVFTGKTDALSIVGGFVEEYQAGSYNVCALSVHRYGIPVIDDKYLLSLQAEIDRVEKVQGADRHLNLKGKTVFQVDTMFANFAQYDIAVLFDDHIFLMAGYDGYLPEYAKMLVKQYSNAVN